MNPNERLQSLDTLRGFDMLFIMGFVPVVVALCSLWPNPVTDAIAASMYHREWDGLTHHDTIFPLFLFIAGISFPFSLAKQQASGLRPGSIYGKILKRMAILIVLGMIYNGLFKLNFETLRCASVLGRIGLAWGVAAILYMNFGIKARIGIAAVILVGYGLLSALVAAPDIAGGDPFSLEGCLAGYVDRHIVPGTLYLKTFDPEGLFSAIPAVVTAMLGMFTGEFIRRSDLSGSKKTLWMFGAAVMLAVVAVAFNGVLPVNKSLWSSTFVCAVGAYSLAMFALFYYLIDVRGWRRWTLFFQVIGLNSITIYMAQRFINFQQIGNFFFGGLASKCPENIAALITASAYVAACWVFLYFLYRKKVFLKV